MFRFLAAPYLKEFEGKSPEKILKRSLDMLDTEIILQMKDFVRNSQSSSGGFRDRAGNPDLYYTLFGWFAADALGLKKECGLVWPYVSMETGRKEPEGVYLHCAAILSSLTGRKSEFKRSMGARLKKTPGMDEQKLYGAFLSLLSYWYLGDFRGMLRIRKKLKSLALNENLPCPVTAASLVLARSFREPVSRLIDNLLSFFDGKGGFRAARSTPLPDLLSTAVALYALDFCGYDLREIKPDALYFTDSLFRDGGFSGHPLDPIPILNTLSTGCWPWAP
jgi:hypothetical protein